MNSRELQIAFERKIMLMDPTLRDAEKLTSDTIFAFLNAAQDRYYEQLYQQFDQIESVGRIQFRNSDLLKGFISTAQLENKTKLNEFQDEFKLPEDYEYYVKSNSLVTGTYMNNKTTSVSGNKDIKYDQINTVTPQYFDKKIIRTPYAALNTKNDVIMIIHDEYTDIEGVSLTYYRKPKAISLNQECEFPDIAHQTIVDLAVEIFVTESKYRLNMKQS